MYDSTYRHLAVAIDGSPASDAAVGIALRVLEPGGKLAFVHAVNRRNPFTGYDPASRSATSPSDELDSLERAMFERAERAARANRVRSTRHSLPGEFITAVTHFTRSNAVDALVLGARGDLGIARPIHLSKTQVMVRLSHIPTIVAGPAKEDCAQTDINRIVVAIDGSEPSQLATDRAIGMARRTGADVTFAYVAERELHKRSSGEAACSNAYAQATAAGVSATPVILHGAVSSAVTGAANMLGADLLIVGTHARFGPAFERLGSIAEGILREASCPVMVLRSSAAHAAASA